MWIVLTDGAGNGRGRVWTLAGGELYYDFSHGISYRKTGHFTGNGDPIFKAV